MSNTLGKLQASLASATNELTVAASSINFDFTLVKCEAPKEFQPLGQLLASSKKADAETGETHITARRLGALFSGICSQTPKLSAAYGARVAEISKAATAKEPPEYKKSIFAAYAGVDGTSIWAAATSSKESIQVHLLACMLAELWEPTEAVAIWEEIVIERRRDIANRLDQGEELSFALAAAAAQQGISRDKLALWDASARSWIQTARSVKAKEYKQFELIVKNIDLQVSDKADLLIGVIGAWKLALETMERLIGGEPLEIREGAVLLAISAWHIYSDMHVFGSKNLEIRMKDPLVAEGGIVSVGCRPSQGVSSGVHWSLCLNYLNSYGPPVQKQSSLRDGGGFISIHNFLHAAIGAILCVWEVNTSETRVALEVLDELCLLLSNTSPRLSSAMQTMRKAVAECLSNDSGAMDFLSYERRRPQFMQPLSRTPDEEYQTSPFWGMLNPRLLVGSCAKPDDRVGLLMRLVERSQLGENDAVIYDIPSQTAYKPKQAHTLKRNAGPDRSRRYMRSERHGTGAGYSLIDSQLYYHKFPSPPRTFYFWFGDVDTTAIFIDEKWRRDQPTPAEPNYTLADVLWCLKFGLVSGEFLRDGISDTEPIIRAAFILSGAKECFASIPQVKVHIQALERPFLAQRWANNFLLDLHAILLAGENNGGLEEEGLMSLEFTLEDRIEIIANLVAGLDLHEVPERVVGVSTGDSLLVPSALVRDPSKTADPEKLVRILGNLGQPGFVIFSSPETPLLAPLNEAQWRIHNFSQFNGRSEGLLGSTSLHLSFTDWSYPISASNAVGARIVQGKVMESVISIRDQGRWIGDVDPLRSLYDVIVFTMPEQAPCDHQPHSPPVRGMTAVECWDELMDCPPGELVVVKAHGNWVARLAATAYLVQCAKRDDYQKIKRITICRRRCAGHVCSRNSSQTYTLIRTTVDSGGKFYRVISAISLVQACVYCRIKSAILTVGFLSLGTHASYYEYM